MRRYPTPEERFWPKVRKSDGCWTWTGAHAVEGYGRIMRNGRIISTHRFSWELHFGSIPNGMSVLHRCDNPFCVNPDHLFLGTNGDNNRDRSVKGRTATGNRHGSKTRPERVPAGENHPGAKLTEYDVARIRADFAAGVRLFELGGRYGITSENVGRIVRRETWQHVP